MTSQTGQQIITIHILSNIARSKDNQAMKLGQLKSDSHLANFFFIFALMIAFQNDEKCFLFHLKSSFRSQDI